MLDIELSFFVSSQWVCVSAERALCISSTGLLRIDHDIAQREGERLYSDRIRISRTDSPKRRRRRRQLLPFNLPSGASRTVTSSASSPSADSLPEPAAESDLQDADLSPSASHDGEDGGEARHQPLEQLGNLFTYAAGTLAGEVLGVVYYNLATREVMFRKPREPRLLVDGNKGWRLLEGSGTRMMPVCSSMVAGAPPILQACICWHPQCDALIRILGVMHCWHPHAEKLRSFGDA
jgi:hypothetical protein